MIDKMKVYQDTELSSKAVSVYLYLCERASKETKSCYPSMKTIAKDLHLSWAQGKVPFKKWKKGEKTKKPREKAASFFGTREAFHSRIGKKVMPQKRKSVS